MSASADSTDAIERARQWLARAGWPLDTPLELLPGDASDRRFVRAVPPGDASRVLVVHREPFAAEELPLLQVRQLFDEMSVPVPAVHAVEADLGIVVLEDLGDETLEAALPHAPPAERQRYYDEAVDVIATIQHGGRRLANRDHVVFRRAFDAEKLSWELDFFIEHFLVADRRCTPTAGVTAALRGACRALAQEVADEPRVLCHRDFHSRNLMVHDDRLYVIDLQDARLGPDTYDLASLVRDSYVELEPAVADRLIDRFARRLGIDDGTALRRRFDRTALQRNLKALGTFGYQRAALGRGRYDDAIPRTLAYVRRTLTADDRFVRLHELLGPLVPELRG